jgi:hypothetical protein
MAYFQTLIASSWLVDMSKFMVRVIGGLSNILMCLLVFACSSGGGGGGGGGSGGEGRLTIAQNTINISGEVDGPNLPNLEIRGTVSGVDQQLYFYVDVTENGILMADFVLQSANSGAVFLTPKSPAILGEGIYNDILVVKACLDAACTRHLAGSPKTINVQYRVLDTIRLSAPSISSTYDIFQDESVFSNLIALRGVQGDWSVVSDQPWLTAVAASGVGSQDVTIVASAAGLAPGMNKGTLTFTELATQETTTFVREIFVQEPSITLASMETVELFVDGVSSSVYRTLINGDLKTFELLADAPDWLDVTMGLSSSFQRQVVYKANTDFPLTAGEYTGEVRLYLEIGGVKVGPTVPVTLKVFPSVLTLSDRGIALVHNSLASKLSETVEVSIGGHPTSDWQATVEYLGNHQGWLTVAPNLENLHEMVISAEPDGIADGETVEAIVRVSSQDGTLSETLRVGLNVDTNLDVPARTVVELQTIYTSTWMEADPVRPLLYVANGGDTIEVYHIYTGELVRSFFIPNAFIRHITLAGDGSVLYSLDERNLQIDRIDLTAGLVLSPLQVAVWQKCTQCERDFFHLMIKYVRAYGRDLLITNTPHLLSAETGELLNQLTSDDVSHELLDGQLVVAGRAQKFLASSSYNSTSADLYSVTYAGDGKYTASWLGQWQATSLSKQYSLNRSGTRIYDRCSYPEGLSIYATEDMTRITPEQTDFHGVAQLISDTELLCVAYHHTESNPSPEIWRINIETGELLAEYSVDAYVDENQHIVSGDGQRLITRSEFFRLLTLQAL